MTNTELYSYVERTAKELITECRENSDNLYEYFGDVLDFEYCVDCRKNYLGAKIWVTLGGPNVWIDTRRELVRGAWGTECAEYPLPDDVVSRIDDIFAEYYEM